MIAKRSFTAANAPQAEEKKKKHEKELEEKIKVSSTM